jgi:hypothetical protein
MSMEDVEACDLQFAVRHRFHIQGNNCFVPPQNMVCPGASSETSVSDRNCRRWSFPSPPGLVELATAVKVISKAFRLDTTLNVTYQG